MATQIGFKKGVGDGAKMADHDQSKGGEELLLGMKSGCQMRLVEFCWKQNQSCTSKLKGLNQKGREGGREILITSRIELNRDLVDADIGQG